MTQKKKSLRICCDSKAKFYTAALLNKAIPQIRNAACIRKK